MSISFGNKNTPQIYFGSIPVKEVYFGSSLVWKKESADEPSTPVIELKINNFDNNDPDIEDMKEWYICCETSPEKIASQPLKGASFPIQFYPEFGEEVKIYFADTNKNKITNAAFSFTGQEINTKDYPGGNYYEFSFTMDSNQKDIKITRYWAAIRELLITQDVLDYIENEHFSSPKILCYFSEEQFDTYDIQEDQLILASYYQWAPYIINSNNYETYRSFELWDGANGNAGIPLTHSVSTQNRGYYDYSTITLDYKEE